MKKIQTLFFFVLVLVACTGCPSLQFDARNEQFRQAFSDYRAGLESLKAKQYAAAEENFTSALNNMQSVVDFFHGHPSVEANDILAFYDDSDRMKFNGHTGRGEARYFLKKYDSALEDFAAAIGRAGKCDDEKIADECEKSRARAHYYAGLIRIDRKDFAEAEKHFTSIIDNNKHLQGEARMQENNGVQKFK